MAEMTRYYDRNASNLDLNPGDLVYLKNVQVGQGQKLQNKYRGPLRVLEIVNVYNVIPTTSLRQTQVSKMKLNRTHLLATALMHFLRMAKMQSVSIWNNMQHRRPGYIACSKRYNQYHHSAQTWQQST
jgi:hypothetical protein